MVRRWKTSVRGHKLRPNKNEFQFGLNKFKQQKTMQPQCATS